MELDLWSLTGAFIIAWPLQIEPTLPQEVSGRQLLLPSICNHSYTTRASTACSTGRILCTHAPYIIFL